MSPSVSRRSPMGRHGSRHSISPVRGGSRRERSPVGSPRRSSASGRDRSPAHHKSSHRDSSPKRERHSSRPKSPKREKSTSPLSKSPSPRTKRLRRAQAERETEKAPERARERDHVRGHERSPKREKSNSPVPRSPSPRTKRLRRAQAEREAEKASERARDRVHERGHEKSKHRERDAERDGPRDRRERRPEREVTEDKPSRSRHGRSASPSDRHRSRNHSHSPSRSSSRARAEDTKSTEGDERDDASDSIARMKAAEEALEAKKQKPSFEYSGKLAEETNRVKGVTLLFNEPPDARKPSIRWRLYVFKGGEALNEPLYVHRQSCYLFGRERRVADIPTDHPSCSKQHAVLQYRHVEKEKPDGTMSKQTRPYIMDLGSTNKTFINDNPIEPQRYYELFEKDTIKFGNSSREYVLLHENSLASNEE